MKMHDICLTNVKRGNDKGNAVQDIFTCAANSYVHERQILKCKIHTERLLASPCTVY